MVFFASGWRCKKGGGGMPKPGQNAIEGVKRSESESVVFIDGFVFFFSFWKKFEQLAF
jgi:hypothetical protein